MIRFDGDDYVHVRDGKRLLGQYKRVWDLMKDGEGRTLREISEATGDPEGSVSSQLRHMRKPRFGSHTVLRQHISGGLYRYYLRPSGVAASAIDAEGVSA